MDIQASATNALLQVLRLPQVCKVTGLCRSMIYQLEAKDRFPRRIRIGLRAVGWVEGEVQDWLAERLALSRRSMSDSTLPAGQSSRSGSASADLILDVVATRSIRRALRDVRSLHGAPRG
jgi:prophage regulatory protein